MDDQEQREDIRRTMHDLDRRVTIVETKMDAQTDKLDHIHANMHAITDQLGHHIKQEDADRVVILQRLSMTLVTVLVGMAAFFGQEVFARLFGD